MKNYNFVLGLAVSGLLSSLHSAHVQAANTTQTSAARTHAAPVSAATRDAAMATLMPRPDYHFDSVPARAASPAPAGAARLNDLPLEHVTASLDKTPAQSFAGGTVANAHASPAKSGLSSTQAAPSSVSEPASELLLLLGLSALAIMVRRQSPT